MTRNSTTQDGAFPERMTPAMTAELLGIARSTLAALVVRRKDFPKPIRLSQRTLYYRRSEVEAWIDSCQH